MIVDSHIHIGSWTHADFLGRKNDARETLAMLRSSGIDGAVVMPADKCDNAALLGDLKRARDDERFAGPLWLCAWLRPIDSTEGDAPAELAWVRANRRDVAGLKIHPSLSRRRITDDSFRPALELAAELDLIVLVHCGRWTEIAGFAHALEAAERWPNVRFLFAHAGGDTPPNASGAAHGVKDRGLKNVWFEFSGLREYWVVERNVALIGAERYLMGSDFPLAHPLMYLGALAGMKLSEKDRRLIEGENAVKLFGPTIS